MVECYKKIVCLDKTNWTLCSVLFGLLSTKGTKIYNRSTTEHSSLACGGQSCALSLYRCSAYQHPSAGLTLSPYRHRLCSLSVKTNTMKLNPQTWKNFGYELWNLSQSLQKLYANTFVSFKDIFQGFLFFFFSIIIFFNRFVVVGFFFFFKFIFWSSLFTLKSL